ncbi:hypothetical protein ACTFIZ_002129 [Dictyostelium cf. discoideum]
MAIPPLNCQYEKQGLTLPPTTIYYLYNRGQIGKIARNDIINNSTTIDLFGSTNVSGRLSSVANNETIILSHGYVESYFDQDIFYIQRNIESISSGIIDGWSYDFSYNETYEDMKYHIFDGSIAFDDCSKDYFNVTGWTLSYGKIHFIMASSLTKSYFEFINTRVQYNDHGIYKPFFDKLSMIYYLSENNDELKLSNLIVLDVKKRSSSSFSFEYKENRSPITAYRSFYYVGENLNNKYSIYKYNLSNQLPSNNNNNINNNKKNNNNINKNINNNNNNSDDDDDDDDYNNSNIQTTINKYEIFLELDYEISNVIQSENPSYFILYSDKSNVLIVYNIDTLSYEKYTNFKIPLHHNEKYAQSFIARGGSPIEPNQVKKKNILIPIFISIIGFSVFVFLIIITVFLIKRRNTKKSDEFNKQKDNESEISKQ